MKRILLTQFFVLLLFIELKGQNMIALHHNGKPYFTKYIDSALKNSLEGDTIYLPGGIFGNINTDIKIHKRIHIIGAGYHHDSSSATYATILKFNNFYFTDSCSFTSVEGVKLDGGGIILGQNNISSNFNNILLIRCYLPGISTLGNTDNVERITLINNILLGLMLDSSRNHQIFNNIIQGAIQIQSSILSNNLMLKRARCNLFNSDNNIFRNNYMYSAFPFHCGYDCCTYGTNNIFVNNIAYEVKSWTDNSNEFYGNKVITSYNSTFINEGNGSSYSDTCNYKLLNTSVGKGAGSDFTDVGIYGGLYPWKDGGIPLNPHIQSIYVAPVTKPDGKLPVKIKVKAQNN